MGKNMVYLYFYFLLNEEILVYFVEILCFIFVVIDLF